MFSEELQRLIDASLVDGVITDKERAVIHKRAVQEGVDPDEVDIMLDAKVQKITQKQHDAVKIVKKCPSCGEIIPVMAIKCKLCGYEFREVEANKSVSRLFEELNKIEGSRKNDDDPKDLDEDPILQKKMEVIRSFPIPNTKEDIFEFLSLALPNAKRKGGIVSSSIGRFLIVIVPTIIIAVLIYSCLSNIEHPNDDFVVLAGFIDFFVIMIGLLITMGFDGAKTMRLHNFFVDTWKVKCEQVIMKAQYSLSDDPRLMNKIQEYKKDIKKERVLFYSQFLLLVAGAVIALLFITSDNPDNNEIVDKQFTELCTKIDNLGEPTVETYNTQKYDLLKIVWNPIPGGGKYEKKKKEAYIKKKQAYANLLSSFHEEHYEELGDKSMFDQTDEIRNPTSYIEN